MRNEIVGASFRGLKKTGIAAVLVGKTETVQGPAQSARPAGVATIALLRTLPQKFAGFEIEDTFLRGGAVPANQRPSGSQAMTQRDVTQPAVARFTPGIKDDINIHHDVDEHRICADEGAQILAVRLEPQRLCFARRN